MKNSVYEKLAAGERKMAVLGLGYVGLPVALAFARHFSVIGYDIKKERVALLQQNRDPNREVEPHEFEGCNILFTDEASLLAQAVFYVVCVPTPVDEHSVPDLRPLKQATETIAAYLKPGDYVVYESTTYPGCTEEDCVPILEQRSGLKMCRDFKVGYSPERINPGDREHTLDKIIKVVSGCDEEALEVISKVYATICPAGIHCASSIKVAEAAKIIENTQRDVNIALMNELSRIFQRLGINTYEVLEAARTKWNFLNFTPGLVGGHCISVDPYYLTYKARELGYEPEVITSGRRINDDMGPYIARRTVQLLTQMGKDPGRSRVLVMGATFKENVADLRNSKVKDMIRELQQFSVHVDVMDPIASAVEMQHEFGMPLTEHPVGPYDAIIVAVAHRSYCELEESDFERLTARPALLVDVKGLYRGRIRRLSYWSL
ncbi:MAG: nucleotide sugar dehydrogenase [Chitinophagales bacterium]|nr:nucleotide sugar dehydrogenase [Chitinophagales bacterium]MDW8427874.1 nucleotide sugar dehydrogenase [Chitinophagales bacterium]